MDRCRFLDDKKQLEDYLTQQNITLDTNSEPQTDSLCLLACYGEDTTQAATRLGLIKAHCCYRHAFMALQSIEP